MANETQRLWDLLSNRLTATRAGYLDELDFDLDGRLGAPVGASLAADIAIVDGVADAIQADVGDFSARTNLDSLLAILGWADVAGVQTLESRLGYQATGSVETVLGTPAGASLAADMAAVDTVVDETNAYLEAGGAVYDAIITDAAGGSVGADTSNLLTRLGDPSLDTLNTITAKLGNPASAIGALLESATYGLPALDTELGTIRQKATAPAWNQDTDSLEAIREAIDAAGEKGLAYGSTISGSVTPADGAENIVVETDGSGDYAQDFELFLSIDLGAMAAGDTVVIRVYERIDGTNYQLADEQTLSDGQTIDVWRLDPQWGDEVMDIKVTLAQTAGTYRTFNYRGAARKPAAA